MIPGMSSLPGFSDSGSAAATTGGASLGGGVNIGKGADWQTLAALGLVALVAVLVLRRKG